MGVLEYFICSYSLASSFSFLKGRRLSQSSEVEKPTLKLRTYLWQRKKLSGEEKSGLFQRVDGIFKVGRWKWHSGKCWGNS